MGNRRRNTGERRWPTHPGPAIGLLVGLLVISGAVVVIAIGGWGLFDPLGAETTPISTGSAHADLTSHARDAPDRPVGVAHGTTGRSPGPSGDLFHALLSTTAHGESSHARPGHVGDLAPGDGLDPIAECSVSATTVEPGEPVTVDASASEDVDDYQYARDDGAPFGEFTDSEQWAFEYDEPGNYTPMVKVWSYPSETSDTVVCGTVKVREHTFSVTLSHSPSSPSLSETVVFDANVSGDPEGALEFRWDWTSDGEIDLVTRDPDGIPHEYDSTGRYDATVTVVDESGTAESATTVVAVGPVARCSIHQTRVEPGEPVTVDATDSDGADDIEFARDTGEPFVDPDTTTYTFTYDAPGRYEPRVRAWAYPSETTDETTCLTVEVREQTVSVTPSHSPTSPSVGETVVFDANVSGDTEGAIEYRWDWTGDGEVDTVTEDPDGITHSFDDPGSHDVHVTIVDESGTTATGTTTVHVELVARCSVSPQSVAPGETVEVTAGDSAGAEEYRFARGDDGGYGDWTDDSTRAITYEEPGRYRPRVMVGVADGEATDETTCGTVTVEGSGFAVTLDYEPTTPTTEEFVFFNVTVLGEPTGAVEYEWDWTNDGVIDQVTQASDDIAYKYTESGEFAVRVTAVDDSGATATAVREITVTETGTTTTTTTTRTPDETLSAGWWYTPLDPETGENVSLVATPRHGANWTYEWDVDDDGTYELTGVTAVHAFGAWGNRTVVLRVVGPAGGTAQQSRTITVAKDQSSENGATGDETGAGPSIRTLPYDPIPGEVVTLIVIPTVPTGELAGVQWDLDDDGESDAEGVVATTTFTGSGSHQVAVTIQRSDGSSETVARRVDVDSGTIATTTDGVPPAATRDRDGTATTPSEPEPGSDDNGEAGDTTGRDDDGFPGPDIAAVRRALPVPGFGMAGAVLAFACFLVLAAKRWSQ